MELRLLQYFIAVVEKETFTEAAQTLHISQPSLSAAIKRLEEQVGLTLLERTTRSLALTKEGATVYEEAKKLMTHYEHVTDEITRIREQGPLKLTIGIIESSQFWLPKILRQFLQEYPDVKIKLLEVLSLHDVEKAITNFDVHFAITNQYVTSEDMKMIPIYDEKLVAILPPNHPLKHKQEIIINDLAKENFIICKSGFQTREDILNAFRKAGVKPIITYEIERFETACTLVENNLGITIVPENYVKFSNQPSYHIRKIDESAISRTVYIAYDNHRYLPPLVPRFIGMVKDFFAKKTQDEKD